MMLLHFSSHEPWHVVNSSKEVLDLLKLVLDVVHDLVEVRGVVGTSRIVEITGSHDLCIHHNELLLGALVQLLHLLGSRR